MKKALWITTIIAVIVSAVALAAQPGTQTDPVVSLSYLKEASRIAPVSLEGGEEFIVATGKEIVLLEGRCRLQPPVGNSRLWIVNVRTGAVVTEAVEMTLGGCYLLIAENPEAHFSVQAWESAVIALPGGSGE